MEFTALRPKIWQHLFEVYKTHKNNNLPLEEIQKILIEDISSYGFDEKQSEKIIKYCLKLFSEKDLDASSLEAKITLTDYNKLLEIAKEEKNADILRLITSFLVYQRENQHPSGWIKYDKKVIMYLASLTKKKVSEQERLTNRLHNVYNMNMQVVGSTNPIPCFKFEWHEEPITDDDPDNPEITIGFMTPQSIIDFVKTIRKESKED